MVGGWHSRIESLQVWTLDFGIGLWNWTLEQDFGIRLWTRTWTWIVTILLVQTKESDDAILQVLCRTPQQSCKVEDTNNIQFELL